jgi:hypothetical protein
MAGHRTTLTPRQITFAVAVGQGKSPTEAAAAAGYGNPDRHGVPRSRNLARIANTLAHRPVVAAEIERIRARTAANTEMSAEWWRGELLTVYKAVRDADDAPSALRALDLAGRHLGLLDTKADNGSGEAAARLMANLAAAMGAQMALAAGGAQPKTIEGETVSPDDDGP